MTILINFAFHVVFFLSHKCRRIPHEKWSLVGIRVRNKCSNIDTLLFLNMSYSTSIYRIYLRENIEVNMMIIDQFFDLKIIVKFNH